MSRLINKTYLRWPATQEDLVVMYRCGRAHSIGDVRAQKLTLEEDLTLPLGQALDHVVQVLSVNQSII